MNFAYLIKQPWFQILVGIVLVLALLAGVYYYGKAAGRAVAASEFNTRQADLLKKSQDALALADAAARKAEESEAYAAQLKSIIAGDRKTAAQNEARSTAVYDQSLKEINDTYAQNKNAIASMSDCDRCRDLCERTNKLASYGPEFSSYHCDPSADCQFACNTGNP